MEHNYSNDWEKYLKRESYADVFGFASLPKKNIRVKNYRYYSDYFESIYKSRYSRAIRDFENQFSGSMFW